MKPALAALLVLACAPPTAARGQGNQEEIGREVAVPRHLQDSELSRLPMARLLEHGRLLFEASWTEQEGGGRPFAKGNGAPLSDPFTPLVFPRNFNRLSAPDANACAGCHSTPFGIAGGGGEFVANVFVLAQRFDFATFDGNDVFPTRGALDERGLPVTAQTIANSRASLGMFGSGFIEMLARQMTLELQAVRDRIPAGGSRRLVTKGVSFGTLARFADGGWDVSRVEGLPAPSLATAGSLAPPSLAIRPFHQSGSVVSLRQFTNNAFNHHHGIQPSERFGDHVDADQDGFADEMTRADVTAAVLFQAALPVPGRVIPRDPEISTAIARGERLFGRIGCGRCHVPALPLDRGGWVFTEPSPFNPAGNLRPGDMPTVRLDLTDERLPKPRLKPINGLVWVPAFTDLKLHDISDGPDDVGREPLDLNQPPGTAAFAAGNSRFLTRKLWGAANEPPYFHHGLFTTLRSAVLAHAGEARREAAGFRALAPDQQDNVIEFLKSLRVLKPGTRHLIVDESGRKAPETP